MSWRRRCGTPVPGARAGSVMAPPLSGSTRVTGHPDYVIKPLLTDVRADRRHDLSSGHGAAGLEPRPVDRQHRELVRNSFGNTATWVTAADVARVRAATSRRTSQWTLAELELSLPRLLIPDATWSATASHNPARAAGALDYTRWTSDAPQEPGMWITIALPAPVMLTEIQFDSPPIGGEEEPSRRRRFHGRTVSRCRQTESHGARQLQKVRAVAGRRRSRSRRCERASCVLRKPRRSRTVRSGRSSACGCTKHRRVANEARDVRKGEYRRHTDERTELRISA